MALYDSPQAKVKHYGFKSVPFSIRRGTWQGCPLSPLLFILAMEPLAEAIRSHPDITGVEIAGTPHKISLFADDILITLTNPRITLPNLFSLLDSFASLSGKSKAMSINLLPSDLITLKNSFTFQWLTSLPYLGIRLTPTYAGLYKANFLPILKKLTDMSSWAHLPLSWFGRIVAIRMPYPSKLLYFFRAVPVPFPPHILRIHQHKILKFVWGSTHPRINKQILYARRISGGLSVPNLQTY